MAPEPSAPAARLPEHVAIIMDGNGRWAAERGLSRSEGHRAGSLRLSEIIEACLDRDIKHLTVYALSTENWSRPTDEIDFLLLLMDERLRAERRRIFRNRIRVCVLGSLDRLPPALRLTIKQLQMATANFDRFTLNIAFNYGGRSEIVRAVRKLMRAEPNLEAVTEERLADYLYTAGQPDPDLVIRTGGELRLSNFLLWQSAYAEYWWTPTLWPDFGPELLDKALDEFRLRQRRFGHAPTDSPRVSGR
ncbi:MAG: polyprenyl diphosphate synthase [Chloroflexota bacterium]|nr:polyprenyl diphosphate synthase [Chloroflexota bacterium]MXX66641.1 di-trans,poly-cis-decaprenylcistransferase [Chloroflexota bacterium]